MGSSILVLHSSSAFRPDILDTAGLSFESDVLPCKRNANLSLISHPHTFYPVMLRL